MWTAWDFHIRILNKYCILVVNSTFWVTGRQQHHDMKMKDFCFAKNNIGIEFITFSEGVTKTSGQGLNAKPRLQKPKMFRTEVHDVP